MVLGLLFESLIYFELIFGPGVILYMWHLVQASGPLMCRCSNSAAYLLQFPSFGSGWPQELRSLGRQPYPPPQP